MIELLALLILVATVPLFVVALMVLIDSILGDR